MFKWMFIIFLAIFIAILWESPTAKHQFVRELKEAQTFINKTAKNYEAWQIIAVSVGVTLLLMELYRYLFDNIVSLPQRIKRKTFQIVRKLPVIRTKFKNEMAKTRQLIEDNFLTPKPGEQYHLALPEKGLSYEELMTELDRMDELPAINWKKGFASGCSYNCNDDLTKLTSDVYRRYCWSNPLHPDVFPQIRKMEAEVIHWTVQLFNGSPNSCGSMTSGGTESIIMAMKVYREVGYDLGIRYPEIICSKATHAAFDKAAHLLRMKIIHVSCDPLTRKVNLKAMSKAITKNTVVLVGNAPQFPHGIIDPIQDIAKLGRKYNIGVHVDSCLGGFLLPFMDKAGFPIDPFDFRVNGVTSISADTHKYGYSPKGSSVILYANQELRRKQFFVVTDWEGGIYPSPTLAGSRSGGIIASTWAAMMSMGVDGYVQATKEIITTTRWLIHQIDLIPNVYVIGNPEVSIVAMASKDFNIYRLNEAMTKKGWSLNPLQFPSSIHICITLRHTKEGVAQQFVDDIKECVTIIMQNPQKEVTGTTAFYGTAQAIPDRSIVNEVGSMFLDVSYMPAPTENMQ